MHGSYLITGATHQKRVEKILGMIKENISKDKKTSKKDPENSADIKFIDQPEDKHVIPISAVKEGIKFLQEKPLELQNKYLVIKNAGHMNIEAQNSLLKTLEETPGDSVILLETENEGSVLETILSRCRRIPLGTSEPVKPEDTPNYKDIIKSKVGERLSFSEEISKLEREEVVQFLNYCINEQRKDIQSSESAAENIKLLTRIRTDIETTNVGLRTALDLLMLKLR